MPPAATMSARTLAASGNGYSCSWNHGRLQHAAVEILVRREPAHLRVAVHVGRFVEVVLGPRSAVLHEQRRRVDDARLRDELHDVLVERHDRQRVLEAGIAVEDLREIELEVEAAFDRRHELLLFRRHDDPLPLLPVAGHVLLDRLRVPGTWL